VRGGASYRFDHRRRQKTAAEYQKICQELARDIKIGGDLSSGANGFDFFGGNPAVVRAQQLYDRSLRFYIIKAGQAIEPRVNFSFFERVVFYNRNKRRDHHGMFECH